MDAGQKAIRKVHLSLQHRWAKKNNQSGYSQINNTFVHILVGFVRSFLYSQCYQIMPIHDICSNKKWNGYNIQAQLKAYHRIIKNHSKMHIAPIDYMGYHHTTQYHNIWNVANYW